MKRFSCWFLALSFVPSVAWAGELPQATPQQVHIDPAQLAQADKIVREMVDKKEYAGAVTLVARHGKVVDEKTVGMMDVAQTRPMKADTIFRIYSMSKPITTVAAMMLFEENKLELDDPVSKYIPEMKNLRVYVGPKDETVPAKREITIRDLMRHTSGFTYGAFSDTPVDHMYRQQKLLDRNMPLQEFVAKLAKIPLVYQPGTRFHYSVSVDVLGRVVEVVSGKTLDVFFNERIFKPLDMVDTAFYVPASKVDRFATNYGPGLVMIDNPAKSPYLKPPKFFSGGGGLVSTARDYARFCQMMLERRRAGRNAAPAIGDGADDDRTISFRSKLCRCRCRRGSHRQRTGIRTGLCRADGGRPEQSGVSPPASISGAERRARASPICPQNDTVVVALTQFMPYKPTLSEAFIRAVDRAVASQPCAASGPLRNRLFTPAK